MHDATVFIIVPFLAIFIFLAIEKLFPIGQNASIITHSFYTVSLIGIAATISALMTIALYNLVL